MTRINCVPPSELTDKHLLAEYRELPRVFRLAARAYERGDDPDLYPDEYVLGPGHVKFFYTRLLYLKWRHLDLVDEMRRRQWAPKHPQAPAVANHLPARWWHPWEPTAEALAINRERIRQRL